ncbi:uncharacterized protein LOC6050674 [Culex quinquefasciatus]|uniref:uncharacterized protein LOC6050674 n=1 Tax=Culex quinquefasciatus TaxID=7176 RepID=UPI0018E2A76B|nr:uncharacterized protein LOC6050674 [Culex quinquefasciatus]
MDLLAVHSTQNYSVITAINYLAVTFMSQYYTVCLIKDHDDDLHLNAPIPLITITVDSEFNETFLQAVDAACQAFVVSEAAFAPFLDSFVFVHDQSNQRASGKRLIGVMESADVTKLNMLKSHRNILELPEVVFVCPDEGTESIKFYTTNIFNNGTRGSWNVEIVPIEPPDYFPDKFKDMQGFPIRLSTLMYPPYAYYEQSTPEKANARYDPNFMKEDLPLFLDGTEPTLILEFCRIHNCTIEASFDESAFWGEVFDNRTGTGLLGAVVERRADIAVAAIYFWRKPYDYASYTHHVSRSGITVLVPKPRLLAPWRTPFLSFTASLWIAVLITFIVATVAVWLIEGGRYKLLQPQNEMPVTLSDSLLTMIGFYMEQSARMRTDMVSSVFLFTSLLFAGFMVGNSYGGGLAGVMTIPQYEKPIDTTMDLADSGMPYAGRALSWIFSILYATQPYVKTLVKNYLVVDEDYLVRHSKTHDLGYCGERTEFEHFVPAEFVDLEASSMLQLLKDDLYWETVAHLVTKTCPFKEPYNDMIMTVKQSGMQDFWELRTANRYLLTTVQQNIWNARKVGGDDEVIKLTVSHFLGAYLILTFGCSLGTLAFALEVSQTRIKATFNKIFKRKPTASTSL